MLSLLSSAPEAAASRISVRSAITTPGFASRWPASRGAAVASSPRLQQRRIACLPRREQHARTAASASGRYTIGAHQLLNEFHRGSRLRVVGSAIPPEPRRIRDTDRPGQNLLRDQHRRREHRRKTAFRLFAIKPRAGDRCGEPALAAKVPFVRATMPGTRMRKLAAARCAQDRLQQWRKTFTTSVPTEPKIPIPTDSGFGGIAQYDEHLCFFVVVRRQIC